MCPPPPPAYNSCQANTNCTVTSPPRYASGSSSCAAICGSGVFNYNFNTYTCACDVDCSAGSHFDWNGGVYIVNNTMSNDNVSLILQ